MLGLVTGVPGAKKTVFVVSKLDKIEAENKVNIVKNIAHYKANLQLIIKTDIANQFTFYYDDVGSGHDLKQVMTVLDDDYFDMLGLEYEDLRPDDYYKVATIYNTILSRVFDDELPKGWRYLLPVRTIYTNINALKIDFVRSLYDLLDNKNSVDWRKAPDGSIIVIDEVQLVEPFKQTKNKDDPIIQDLTIHRHRGFDFYFITQSANLLHVQLKDLIGLHWHITVPWGWVSKVYQYGSYRQNPNAVSIKMSAERSFNFSPPVRLFKLYKSTTINTHQKRIPYKPIIIFVSLILFALGAFIWAVGGSKDMTLIKGITGGDVSSDTEIIQNPLKVPSAAGGSIDPKAPSSTIVNENTQKPPIVPPAASNSPDISRIYNPVSGQYYANIDVAVSGALMHKGKCWAYNIKGQRINLSDSECSKYLASSGNMAKGLSSSSSFSPPTKNNQLPVK